jgi:hypothetical protein
VIRRALALGLAGGLLAAGHAWAGTVVLKRSWVEKYKDRATIEVLLHVDDAHEKANTAKKDADLHFAGRATKAGLPLVAEIMNAAGQPRAIALVQQSKGEDPVEVVGAWRLWFEHPPAGQAVVMQRFTPLPPPLKGTNPDHVFEIHPVTLIGEEDLGATLVPIDPGFVTKKVSDAFGRFEKLRTTVAATASSITIQSPKVGYNYVEFELRALGPPHKLSGDDGQLLLADVLDDDGATLVAGVRMIFLPGSAPADFLAANTLGPGDELRVLGIPRVNLNAVHEFAFSGMNDGKPRKLPYEMIVVAIFE